MSFSLRRITEIAVLLVGLLLTVETSSAQYFSFGKNKVQYETRDWSYVQSKHFDVYHYEGGKDLADFTARAAEDAYDQIAELFQYEITDRIPIIVFQSHSDFAVNNAAPLPTYAEGIGGVTELFKNRIAIPFTGDYREYRRVVHHELVHAVLNDMFYGGSVQSIIRNNIRLRIPTWFNEGLAEYAALGWDTESDMYLREAVLEDNLAPIQQLGGYFAYRGGQGVWDFIAERYGKEKVAEVLRRVRTTRSVERAFKQATGMSLKDLSERWHQRLKEIHYPEMAARSDLDESAKALITREEHGGYYNTNPALSPQGDRLAYITTKNGLFDVYLADASTGKTIRKLIDGQTSEAFESLPILTPGITWSPNGEKIAIAVKSGPSYAIAAVDVQTGKSTHYRVPEVDQIGSVAWSPEGERIAFSASRDAQSDIYVLDLQTHSTTNYTNDLFSDHEPSWSPDGEALVFHSDRKGYTQMGRYLADRFEMINHDFSQHDIYLLRLSARRVERLTDSGNWTARHAKFGSDPNKVLFASDRNGIYNLYEKNLETGAVRPLTNTVVGVMQVSLSKDGQKAAVTSLKKGTPSIYVIKRPFEQQIEHEQLAPSVWAERVAPVAQQAARAPVLSVASDQLRQRNPFLRDATDGVPYQRGMHRTDLLAYNSPALSTSSSSESPEEGSPPEESAAGGSSDSTTYGETRVDFRNYVFGEGYEQARQTKREDDPGWQGDPFEVSDNVDEEGDYKSKRYKLKFSLDLITGTTSYDVLYGMQGLTQMRFSDMLGNHRMTVASNLRIDLRNSNYYLAYSYLPHRWDWSVFGYHTAVFLQSLQGTQLQYYRYRNYGAGISGRYPIDKFQRIDLDLSGLGVSRANVTAPSIDPTTRFLLYPTVTYTRDVTVPGLLAPQGGSRLALSLSGSPGNLVSGEQIRFTTLLGDARVYTSFWGGRYTLAARLSGGTSHGPSQQLFYAGGVQNWFLGRQVDPTNGLPLDDLTDFFLATPVLPLRGYGINAQNGSHFGLMNLEFRAPLVAALLPGPIPVAPLYNIQATTFLDAGVLWGGRGTNEHLRLLEEDERRFEDLMVGAGLGLRTILFGFPLRVDFAWPFDGQDLGDRRTYVSIGLDF